MTVKTGIEEYEKAISALQSKFKDKVVKRGNEYEDTVRIPTGILEIDSLIGGGFPMGRFSHVYGEYSSGKTLIALNLIREAQKMGLSCVYYDLENQYDKAWAEGVGVDTSKLTVIEGNIIEETGEALELFLGVANIHIIDSVGAGVSTDELVANAADWRMGIHARSWGKIIRRVNNAFDKNDNAIIMINQSYTAFGKSYDVDIPTGGKKIDFFSSLTLRCAQSYKLYKDRNGNLSRDGIKEDPITGDVTPAGIELQMKLTKNKIPVPRQMASARVRLEFGTGGQFDEVWTLVRAAIHFKIVEANGSWYTLPVVGIDGKKIKVQGEKALREAMVNNEELMELAKKAWSE